MQNIRRITILLVRYIFHGNKAGWNLILVLIAIHYGRTQGRCAPLVSFMRRDSASIAARTAPHVMYYFSKRGRNKFVTENAIVTYNSNLFTQLTIIEAMCIYCLKIINIRYITCSLDLVT